MEAAIAFYGETLGLPAMGREVLDEFHVEVAFFAIGESKIELLAAVDGKGPVATFLDKRGEGVHHICFEVDDLEEKLAEMEKRGCRCIEGPRQGAEGKAVAFLSPRTSFNVLLELAEKRDEDRGI
jgi:methylmalonyl-CoA/ethylmalonyl-CoA epimerase